MDDTFNRDGVIAQLSERTGTDAATFARMTDGQLVDKMRELEQSGTATAAAAKDAVTGKGDAAAIDKPESDLIGELVTLTHGHMPDVTPAQARAFAVMAAGYAVDAGVPLNTTTQIAVAVGATLFPLAWIVVDAFIRYGRAKHIFGSH